METKLQTARGQLIGRAVRKEGRRMLQNGVDGGWQARGSTADGCLPCLGLAGLRLLLWSDLALYPVPTQGVGRDPTSEAGV